MSGGGSAGCGDTCQPSSMFNIRPATSSTSDAIYIAEAFDSALENLASIGSGQQWGSHSRRDDAAFIATMEQIIEDSIKVEDKQDTSCYIAEVKLDSSKGGNLVRCGGAIVKSILPDYVKDSPQAMVALEGVVDFDYLCFLIADQRIQPLSRGVGSALIQHVKNEATRKGRKALLVDCWDGNNGILASYYYKHGFRPIASFSKMGKHIENLLWTGLLLQMDL